MRFPALRNRQFVIYTAGSVAAVNGIWINRVVIGWLGWELTGLASWVGILSFFLFAPTIVSSPLFGVILDRVDPRRAGVISQLVLIVSHSCLFALYVTNSLSIWALGAVALAIGVTASADRTIRFVMVPRIVGKEALANAVAIHGINFNTARLIGPALGGFLIDWAGTDITILVNIAIILPFLAVLFLVRLRDRDAPKPKQSHFFAEIVDGARHAAGHPVIREAMVLSGLFSITVRGVLEILPAIADGEFGRGAQGLGQMLAASGAGALVAAIYIAVGRGGPSEARVSPTSYFAIALGTVTAAILGATGSWLVAMAMVFILGFCLTLNGIGLQSSVQLALTDTYRGRVMSLWIVLVIGGAALSAIALGFVADLLGMSVALIGSAASCAVLVGLCHFGWFAGRPGRPPPSS